MNLGKIEHDILKLKVNPTEIKENTFFQLCKKKMSSFTKNLLIFWRCFPTSHLFRVRLQANHLHGLFKRTVEI